MASARQRELDRLVALYLAQQSQRKSGAAGPLTAESGRPINYHGPRISEAEVRRAAERAQPAVRQSDSSEVVRDEDGRIVQGDYKRNTTRDAYGYAAGIERQARGLPAREDSLAAGRAAYWRHANPGAAAAADEAERANRPAWIRRDPYHPTGQYGNPGVVRTSNLFEEKFNEHQRQVSQTVFDALNLDSGIDAGMAYNVGATKESFSRYFDPSRPEGRQEGQSDVRGDVQDLRAGGKNASQTQRDVLVRNTIQGGVADFQRMSVENPDLYNSMVYRLWQAGLVSGDIAEAGLGAYTVKAGKALASAMSVVSQLNDQGSPITLDEYIDNLTRSREQALKEHGGGAGGAGPAPRRYTDPAALKETLKSASQSVLGRALTDDEADAFAAAFHGKEDSAYSAAEAGKNYTDPDPSGQAQQFVENGNETEAAAFRIQGFMERLKQEMGL